MPMYMIENASSCYTIEAKTPDVATTVAAMVGRGYFGLTDESKNTIMPMFAFLSPEESVQWAKLTFGCTLEQLLKRLALEENQLDNIVSALESIVHGNFDDRQAYFIALEKVPQEERPAFTRKWNDDRRKLPSDLTEYSRRLIPILKRLFSLMGKLNQLEEN